jgi:hypothetical protein
VSNVLTLIIMTCSCKLSKALVKSTDGSGIQSKNFRTSWTVWVHKYFRRFALYLRPIGNTHVTAQGNLRIMDWCKWMRIPLLLCWMFYKLWASWSKERERETVRQRLKYYVPVSRYEDWNIFAYYSTSFLLYILI